MGIAILASDYSMPIRISTGDKTESEFTVRDSVAPATPVFVAFLIMYIIADPMLYCRRLPVIVSTIVAVCLSMYAYCFCSYGCHGWASLSSEFQDGFPWSRSRLISIAVFGIQAMVLITYSYL